MKTIATVIATLVATAAFAAFAAEPAKTAAPAAATPANKAEQWTNYLGCAGSSPFSIYDSRGRGVFLPLKGSRVSDILDGLSNTLFLGEVTGQFRDGVNRRGRENSFSWLSGAQSVQEALNYDRRRIPGQDSGLSQFRSGHGPLVHFSFVDGRVDAIHENIDQRLLEAMATIAEADMSSDNH